MLRKQSQTVLSILTMVTTIASAIVILIEVGSIMSAQSQGNATSSLTAAQKDAICNPNNPASKLKPVNTTESRICGIPVTVKPHPSNTTSSGTNLTTGTATPSPSSPPPPVTSIAPSATPPS